MTDDEEEGLAEALATYVSEREQARRARTPEARRALMLAASLRFYAVKLDAPAELVGARERAALRDIVERLDLASLTIRDGHKAALVHLVYAISTAARILQARSDVLGVRARVDEARRIVAQLSPLYPLVARVRRVAIHDALDAWASTRRGKRPRRGEPSPRERKVKALEALCRDLRVAGRAEDVLTDMERVLRRLHRYG